MIQRIQSLYLLGALLLTGSLFFLDLAELISADGHFILTAGGIINQAAEGGVVMSAFALTLLLVVSTFSVMVSLFLFKKRLLQIRICGLNLGLLLGISVMIFYFGKAASGELSAELTFKWPLVMPLISMILVFMAIRAIGRDEALVRSLDRIR
jgi:hypothetical protein